MPREDIVYEMLLQVMSKPFLKPILDDEEALKRAEVLIDVLARESVRMPEEGNLCPNCGEPVDNNYCPCCGQHLDWR